MKNELRDCELFQEMGEDDLDRIAALAEPRSLRQGDYLFLLGDPAERMFVVLEGEVETCMPLSLQGSMEDVAVERLRSGSALGWSAFVRPHRFTLSARAAGPCSLAAFRRADLEQVFARDPRLGLGFLEHIVEMMGRRLFSMQALWARELQRAVDGGRLRSTQVTPAR